MRWETEVPLLVRGLCVCVFVCSCSDLKERLLSLTHTHAYIVLCK